MKNAKPFFTAFTVSLCVLGLGAGLFVAGYNTRRMTRGQTAPTASFTLQNGRLSVKNSDGKALRTPLPEEKTVGVAAVPAPARVTLYLLQRLTAAAERLAELAGEW